MEGAWNGGCPVVEAQGDEESPTRHATRQDSQSLRKPPEYVVTFL